MKYFVTGGSGFIGSAIVARLASRGHQITVLDDHSRGRPDRLTKIDGDLRVVNGDVRDAGAVTRASVGADTCIHLAAVNGTSNFYRIPERVLDVGIRGMLATVDACRNNGIRDLFLASTSEVYQQPPIIPTPEAVPLVIPDPYNPRYSYAASKIASELIALNYARDHFARVVIFRPHNVYGPDMGWEHVIPQLACQVLAAMKHTQERRLTVRLKGNGEQTRSFIYIDDFVNALELLLDRGENRGTYHIGTRHEVRISDVASAICRSVGRDCDVVTSEQVLGETMRRCPDTSRIEALGFAPNTVLDSGIALTVKWYSENLHRCPTGDP